MGHGFAEILAAISDPENQSLMHDEKIIIVLADGLAGDEYEEPVAELKNLGAKIMSVGVGEKWSLFNYLELNILTKYNFSAKIGFANILVSFSLEF